DKNMPGSVMAMGRLNRPSIMLYGGTIAAGHYKGQDLNIVSAFEALGQKIAGTLSNEDFKGIVQHSCPGAGACGGMYTANTIAMAKSVGVKLTQDDFQTISNKIPVLADFKPSGKYLMQDLHQYGGLPSVMKYLLQKGLLHGDCLTVTGKTIAENLEDTEPISF